MRIGFRHCLLSSCLFRCSAGWLRWDGKAVCQRGSLCLGGRRGSRTGGRATAPVPALLPLQASHTAFPRLSHQRQHGRCPHHQQQVPSRGSDTGMPWAPRLLSSYSSSSPLLALRLGTVLTDRNLHCWLPRSHPSLVCVLVFCFLRLLVCGG